MSLTITIKEKVLIKATPKVVWDYTQNFELRKSWDKTILDLKVIQLKPFKIIHLKTVGGVVTNLVYKLCRKYEKTTLKMEQTKSLFIKGGGGSWKYETDEKGTKWIQSNSLTLKNRFFYFTLGSFIQWSLSKNTRKSMMMAKAQIKKSIPLSESYTLTSQVFNHFSLT